MDYYEGDIDETIIADAESEDKRIELERGLDEEDPKEEALRYFNKESHREFLNNFVL